MIVTRELDLTLDLDGDDIYSYDIETMLMNILNKRFKGVCYMKMLIVSIDEIMYHSDRRMVTDRLDGGATIDVHIKVSGMILNKGEILQGCRVVQITAVKIFIEQKYVSGTLVNDPSQKLISTIAKDTILPVIVSEAWYQPGKSQITILAMPYYPIPTEQKFYSIISGFSQDEVNKFEELLADYKLAESYFNDKRGTGLYKLVAEILYPYKNKLNFGKTSIGSKFTAITVEEAKNISSGWIHCPHESEEKFIWYASTDDMKQTSESVVATAYTALSSIISNRITYLQNFRGFMEQYPTVESHKSMKDYWTICQRLKV